MLINYPSQPPHNPGSSADRWTPRRVMPIVLGALLVTMAAADATSHATTAQGALSTASQHAGCTEVSPGAANLLGAMEGQPPIPDQGVWAATPGQPARNCPTH